jgi:hypothetical protein
MKCTKKVLPALKLVERVLTRHQYEESPKPPVPPAPNGHEDELPIKIHVKKVPFTPTTTPSKACEAIASESTSQASGSSVLKMRKRQQMRLRKMNMKKGWKTMEQQKSMWTSSKLLWLAQ